MAEIILSQAGGVVGRHLLPGGLNLFGHTISAAAIGQALGSVAGRAIDAALAPPIERPRLKSLHIMDSREGAALPLVYGRMRVGGQVICSDWRRWTHGRMGFHSFAARLSVHRRTVRNTSGDE